LAIGAAANPSKTQPLDWSTLSVEKVTADTLKSSCNINMLRIMQESDVRFDPQRALVSIFPVFRVIRNWNLGASIKMKVFQVLPKGTIVRLGGYDDVEPSRSIYIRLNNDRWEGGGYFQEPASPADSRQPSRTLSAISQIDIEPSIHADAPDDYYDSDSSFDAEVKAKTTESGVECLIECSTSLIAYNHSLCHALEKLDVSRHRAVRPSLETHLRNLYKAAGTAQIALSDVRDGTAKEIREAHLNKLRVLVEQHHARTEKIGDGTTRQSKDEVDDKHPEQRHGENAKQEQDKSGEQEMDKHVKQKSYEHSDQKDCEVAEQQKREEAIAIAASYAEQDRYDSCSDSDED
jgi:hypothetical protein